MDAPYKTPYQREFEEKAERINAKLWAMRQEDGRVAFATAVFGIVFLLACVYIGG